MTVGWLDLTSGASGDMLLGALVGAGVPLERISAAVGALELPIRLAASDVQRAGLAAVKVTVDVDSSPGQPRRTWADVRALLARLDPFSTAVQSRATAVFEALARAEGVVHGIDADAVHFHEVGALDALADVVGVAAGLEFLGLAELVAGPPALGGGTARTEHGLLPVPTPAVLELLRAAGAPAVGGGDVELCTPTGAALVVTSATRYGPMPAMTVHRVGVGAGSRDLLGRPNVVRLLIGDATGGDRGDAALPAAESALLIEANVDDLDPRLWPGVLAALLGRGAADAWLTPILMKKGRPAHTVSVLVAPALAGPVRTVLFTETTTLGVRETELRKRPLARSFVPVDVDGHRVAVKIGRLADGTVSSVQPEWEDVAAAAAASGRPAKDVLADATALGRATAVGYSSGRGNGA